MAWSEGQFTTESIDGTSQLNATAIGKATVLREILELEPSDFLTEQQQ